MNCYVLTEAQNDFNGSFKFVDVPVHAIQSGLGGINISLVDKDVNLMSSNPALVGGELGQNLSLSYILYPGDIKISNASYLTNIGSTGNWGVNLVYFNYGELNGFDPTGAPTGKFNANEYAFTINRSHQIGNYRLGGNLKYAYSGISGYSASALFADLGGVFIHPEKDFTAALLIKNAGIVISDYTEQSDTGVPFDVQIGTSFKPTNMPVRFSFTMYDLTDWQNIDEGAEEAGIENPSGVDNFFRHTLLGVEFLLGKNVEILFGYNHKRRKELKLSESSGSSGISYGIMIGVQSFEFGFSRLGYQTGAISNTFTLTSDLGRWIKKKNITE